MAKKDYSNVLGNVLDDLEKRKNNQQNENYKNQLVKSPYADVYRSLGLLDDSESKSSGSSTIHYSDPAKEQIFNPATPLSTPAGVMPQLSNNPGLTHNFINAGQTNNSTLNSFLASEQNRKEQEHRQAISQAMNTGFLSKVKGNQQNQQPVMPEIPAAPATSGVSDPLQKIIDLVSGNTANADTRNPALPEVTVNRGVAPYDWSRGIRQYTDENGNIVRDENGNAYAVDKLRFDGHNYSTVHQTDNDPMKNSTLDKILDSLEYIRAKGANTLEREYQKFRAFDAGISGAFSSMGDAVKGNAATTSGGLKLPNLNPFAYSSSRAHPVLQSSRNEEGRIKTDEEFKETTAAGDLMGKMNQAYTKALEEYMQTDAAGKELEAIEKKYGAVASNPVTRFIADVGAAIDGQIPYIALNFIPGAGPILSASARGALSSVDAYAEARREGATKTQARAYAGREAINQGAGDLLISGIAGRGMGALGKVIANNKVGRALAKAYGTHITSPMLKTGIKYFGTMLGEGGEEALQKLIETANKRSTYDPNARVSGKEVAYEGILGGLVAGFFNAPDVPANYRAYKSDFDTVNGLSKAAAAVTSFDEARYVLLQCDILLDECNIALGDTSAPVNETDFDTRARYEYIRNGVQRVKDTLQTDSTAIIEGNTIFNDAVDSAIGIDFGATADMNVDEDEAYEEEEDYEEDEEAEAEEAEPEKTLTKKEQREIAKRQKRIQKLQEQLDRITRRSPNSPVTPGDLAIYDEIRTLRAEIDTILGEQMTPETVADVVEAATENAEPGTDAVRATIDRVNDAIVDINETAEAVREMNDEEFRDWMRANRMSGPFSGIVDAVVNRQTNLLPGPSGRATDLSVETAMNTDLAKNQILSDLELKKAGLQQIDSFLRNHKAEVTEALGVQEQHPDQQNILSSAGESDIIGSKPAENATEQRVPKYTVTRQSYTHTKTHDKFELLQTPEGLSAEERSEFKKAVKDNGGYWSGFAKGWLVPEGKWDGVQKALEDLNIGIRTKGTESPSTQTETPKNTTPAEGERAPEFVVGGPSESAGAETITAERPDIPEFEVAGNTDMVPQSGTTEVQNSSETAVNETGTRSDTGRGTNETVDNETASAATAPEVDGLNAPETTTGKTNVNAEGSKEPEKSEKAQEKWTPDSKEKLTADNFPYKLGTMVDHTSVATGHNVREFLVDHDDTGAVIGTDGKYKTVKYEDFERLIRNGYYRIFDPVSDNVTNHFVNEYRSQQKEPEKTPEVTAEPAEETAESEETAAETEPYKEIADFVADRLGRELAIDKKDLQVIANGAYGGTQAEGAYTVKDMTDALELGVNRYIIKDVSENLDEYTGDAGEAVATLNDINEFILGKIPTQTGRTEEQIAMQQFSTPPNIAFVANWVANIDGNDTVLEPSAGIGGLASFAKGMGAKTIVNELSERRLSLLKTLPFDGFYHENAEQIDNILPDSVKPTVVVMNPPFSANGRTKNKTANAIPHIEQALARLEDGGRLVAILGGGRDEGGGMSDKAPAFRAWWNQLREDYSIRANIGIEGSNYKKYGTSFNVRLVVIDKTGAQKEPTLTGEYKDLSEAIKDLEDIRNDRTRNQGTAGGQRNGTVSGGGRASESGTAQGGKRSDSGRRSSDRGGQNQPGEQSEGETVRSGQSGRGDTGANLESEAQPEGEVPRTDGERGSGQGGERGTAGGSDGDSEGGERGSGRVDSADTGAGASGESGELVRPGAGVSGTAVNEEFAIGDIVEAGVDYYEVVAIDENGEPQFAPYSDEEAQTPSYEIGDIVEYNGKNYEIVDFESDGSPVLQEYRRPRKNNSGASYSIKAPERITISLNDLNKAVRNNQIKKVGSVSTGITIAKPNTAAPKLKTLSLSDLQAKGNAPVKKVLDKSNLKKVGHVKTPQPQNTTIDNTSVMVPTDTTAPGASGTLVDDERKTKPKKQKKKKAAENDDGVYANYRTADLTVKGAKKHPAVLVESSAMSAVQAPPLTYVPMLDQKLIEAGVWSDAQLETISYAGQAHQDHLPDGRRKGYFIGDGTGVGKGRQIAGIIMDSFAHGHKKAVWISEKAPLIEDARRDWEDAGGDPAQVWEFAKENNKRKQNAKKGKKYDFPDSGILFIPYSTLRAGAKNGETNVEVIERWLGEKTSDCIIFDEAHNMANLEGGSGGFGKKKPSQQAIAGNKLQDDLPDASVTYLSATGATNIENLAYASRLGLWGEKTAFESARDFAAKIGSAGISAMELVARDMKAMGVYLARSISYDGVVYDNITHNLSDVQTAMYDRMSEGWQVVLQNFDKALHITGGENNAEARRKKSNAYSIMQMFYNQVLTSMSMPTVIKDIEKELKAGHSCVIQLVNTQEAALKKALSDMKAISAETGEDEDFDSLDLTPRDALITYVKESFPVQQYEATTDKNGNEVYVPVTDSEGNPVLNKQAVRMRDALIEDLNNISVPEGPLDMLILHFGADAVAEVSGRTNRVVNKVDERGNIKKTHEKRDSKKANVAEGKAFQDGKKRILVFSSAGATGRSFHADKRAKNQEQRVHYVLQPGWRADQAVQGFGRTHRSNQVSAPIFRLVSTNVMGHKRFVTSIARRLDQLGALTKGQRETGSGVFGEKDNLESPLSSEALRLFYKTLANNGYKKTLNLDGEAIFKKLGLYEKFFDEFGNYSPDMELAGKITTFLNRILALPVDEQNRVFGAFEAERDRMYTAAIESGTLDRGLENVKADKIEIADEEVVYTDPKTGAETKYIRAKLYDKPEVVTTVAEAESKYPGFVGIYRLPDGSVKAAYRRRDGTDARTGETYKQFMLIGPNQGRVSNYRESTLKATCTEVPKKEWQSAWDEDLKEVPAYNESEVHMITGALLPIWGKLPENGNIKARRITTSDGEQYLGRIIAPDSIDSVLRGLSVNVKKTHHTGAELRDAVLKQGKTITFNGDTGGVITVSKKRVSNENRMEIVAPNMYGFQRTHPDVFSEYIQYRTRYFIPDNRNGEALLQKLSDENGVRSIGESENSGQLYSVGSSRGRWGKGKRDRSAEVRSINDLVDEAQRIFGIPMNTGKMGNMPRSAQGVFKEQPETIRTRQYGDLPTIAHEIGHWFDKKYDLHSSQYIASLISEFETDLKRRGYSDSLISRESVAEYFREYMSDREATEQKFPQFTNWMYKKLNTRDNRGLLEYSGMTNAYFAADLDRRASAQVHYRTDDNSVYAKGQVVLEQFKRNPQDYLGTLSRDFVRNVFDDLVDLRGFGRTYDLAYYEKQARSIAYGRLTSAFTDKNGNVVGKSLMDILSAGKIDERNAGAFDEYLIARVALDHFEAAENGEKVGTLIYGDEELNDADSIAERIVRYERENPTFHQTSEEVYQYERNLLDLAVNSGLMSEELRDRLNELYPHYVPLFRVMDDRNTKPKGAARGYANQSTPIARFKGSGRDIWSPIESIITNTERFTAACMRNDVMMEFTNFIDRNEGFGWAAERIPQAKILDFISTDELGKKLDYFAKNTDRLNSMNEMQKAELVSDIMEFIGDTLSQWKPAAKQGKNVVSVMRNGKRQYYEVHDKGLFKALTNMDAPQFDLLTKFFGAVTRMNKFFYTTSNPQFVFTNPQRDLVTGFISSTTTDNPFKYLWDFGKAWVDAVTNSEEYQEYVRNGGGYMGSVTSDYNILKRVKKDVIKQNKSQIKRFMDVVYEIVPRLVDAGESASRLAEWKRAIAQGDNYMEALRKAQEVTVNFARGGRVVKQINQFIPFFQAGFNAIAHNYDMFVNGGDGGGGRNGNNGFGLNLSPEGKSRRRRAWIKWFLTTGLLALLTWLYNYVIAPKITGESEEEVKQSYDNLSNYNKNAFYNMYIGDDKFIRIKKTQDMSVPATIVERMAEYYVLEQKDSLNGLADFVFDNILPANPHSVGDILSEVSGVGTFVDLYRNEDFKGSPIVSSRYQYLPKEEQYKENTSQIWIALGRAFKQSPIQLQYAAEDNFGWAARLIDNLTPYNGERSLGIKNKLVVDSVYSTDTINNFYDQKDYYDKAAKAYKANPGSKRYSLEDVLGAYKYSKIADLYSDLNNRTRDEGNNDLSREMRRRTNALIQTVNEDGISDMDRAVIDLAETTGTDIGDIAPYLVTPDHISVKVDKKNVSLDMDYDDMYTYYTQAQTAFENVYGRIIQAGYDDATTAALMVEARKVINKELRDIWGHTLLERQVMQAGQ